MGLETFVAVPRGSPLGLELLSECLGEVCASPIHGLKPVAICLHPKGCPSGAPPWAPTWLLCANRQLALIDFDLHLLPEIEARLAQPFPRETKGGHLVLVLE